MYLVKNDFPLCGQSPSSWNMAVGNLGTKSWCVFMWYFLALPLITHSAQQSFVCTVGYFSNFTLQAGKPLFYPLLQRKNYYLKTASNKMVKIKTYLLNNQTKIYEHPNHDPKRIMELISLKRITINSVTPQIINTNHWKGYKNRNKKYKNRFT